MLTRGSSKKEAATPTSAKSAKKVDPKSAKRPSRREDSLKSAVVSFWFLSTIPALRASLGASHHSILAKLIGITQTFLSKLGNSPHKVIPPFSLRQRACPHWTLYSVTVRGIPQSSI